MRSVIRMSNIAFATLLLSLLVFASQSVQAAPTVINTADAGVGSLRQAIIDATAAAAATTIDFAIPLGDPGYNITTDRFTITLLTPLPNIPLAPLTINNATGRGVTVKGGSSFRVFTLVNSAVVIINNLTISNGNSNGVGNLAKGGGIFMGDSAVLTLNNCIVSDNTAINGGGGIWMNNSGTLHIFDSTISNNTTTGENGGGIRIFDSGTLNITRSTVSGNHANATAPAGGGGGIYNGVSGTVTTNNITVSGNTAGNQGGGINNSGVPATATINSSTISGNTATVGGGGIFNGPTTTATLNNSLVALNTGAGSPDLLGPFTANSSLIGNADGSTISGAGNQLGTTAIPINPKLGPLQNNGGPPLTPFTPTFTQALLAGSPAIDAGATALPTDQRGVSRPKDGDGVGGAQSDIGSFESEGLPELTINDVTVAEPPNGLTSAIFTVSLSRVSGVPISVNFATADGTATAGSDYVAASGTLVFAPGETSKAVTVTVFSDLITESAETFFVNLTNPVGGAQIPDNQGIGTILDTAAVPTPTPTPTPGPPVQFAASTYSVGEGTPFVDITVTRSSSAGAAAVDYSTNDFMAARCDTVPAGASAKCDYATAGGTLRFADTEGSKVIRLSIIDDAFVEGDESLTIGLSNPVGLTLGSTSSTTITILDNDTDPNVPNPYLNNAFFVRMQYLDFLLREPDTAGFADWNSVLNGCGPQQGFLGAPTGCDRVHVSSGFFRSPEFGEKGYWVYRFFEGSLGRRPQFAEFTPEMRRLSGLMTAQEQEIRRADFTARFMQLPEFTTIYTGITDASHASQFIAKLEEKARVTLPASTTTGPGQPPQYARQQLIDLMSSGQFTAAETMRAFIEQKVVWDAYFFKAFVAMEYFGYLRRDPEPAGYDDWVDVLTNGRASAGIAPGDFRHLVFGFIYSIEYRERFGKQ